MNTNQDGTSPPIEPDEDRYIEEKRAVDREVESSQVTEIDVPQDGNSPAKRPNRTLEEILTEHFEQVPEEEWDRLPDDLIDRLDFYTSGADV